jgi:hypothetical protein
MAAEAGLDLRREWQATGSTAPVLAIAFAGEPVPINVALVGIDRECIDRRRPRLRDLMVAHGDVRR